MNEMNESFAELSPSASFQLYRLGLGFIRFLQQAQSPALTASMKIITNLVSQFVFFGAVMLLFWLADERRAFRFGLLIICSSWFNGLVKSLFKQPRPFHLESALGMIPEGGYGFPSGHAQLILIFTIPLASWLCTIPDRRGAKSFRLKGLIWSAAFLLVLLVSFSRLYLGVHFPQDILGGWILGILSLAIYFLAEKQFAKPGSPAFRGFLEKPRYKLILAAAAALLMNSVVYDNTSAAMLFGFAAAYVLMKAHWPFTAGTKRPLHVLLYVVIGFVGALALYLGLKTIFPGAGSSHYRLFRFIRYALLGFWVSGGAPWIFLKLKGAPKAA
jgi:membrane-associated phospholipid phosphatase